MSITVEQIDTLAELLPCPFCGRDPVVGSERGCWMIMCPTNDHEVMTGWRDSRDAVIAAWNTREATCKESLQVRDNLPATREQADEIERLRAANKRLRDGYSDALGGLRYIEQHFGRFAGVGWQRVEDHFHDWVTMPEREGLLAGSHDIAALNPKQEQDP